MAQSPLVSVIIPAYNSAQWIEECLRSVAQQSYDNVEIIVVDDGSQDDTPAIISSLDIDLILVKQKNAGRGAARNTGIKKAGGNFLAMLDADDILLRDSIEKRVDYLIENKDKGWVFTDAMEFDQRGDLRLFMEKFDWLRPESDQFVQLLKACFPLTSTVMIRAEILEKAGGFNPEINYAEDLELFLRLALLSEGGYIREPLTRRRIHPEQAVSNTFDRWDSRVRIFTDFKTRYIELDSRQKEALENALKHAWFKLGECYWGVYNKAFARKCFQASLDKNEWSRKARFYILLSFLPIFVLRILRFLRGH